MSGRGSWTPSARLGPAGRVLSLGLGLGWGSGSGCGPAVELGEPEPSSSSGVEASTSGSGSGTTSSTSDGAEGTTAASTETGEPPGGYEEDGSGTGCTFTCPDPPPQPPPPGGSWCNLSCPEGEKCMPWANDGGSVWNTVRCSPVADDPNAPGEPCMVEGSPTSGIDDCDEGSLCWQVDLETLIGTCHAFCEQVDGQQLCPEGQGCALLPPDVPLCQTMCDPVASACDPGMRCLPGGSGFVCLSDDGRGAALGEPCDAPDGCVAGALCAFTPAITCGNAAGQGCCAAPCDVNAPGPCGGPMSTCIPWFPLRPPPELAHVGACAEP